MGRHDEPNVCVQPITGAQVYDLLCSEFACLDACIPGFGDCDGDPDNGCEADHHQGAHMPLLRDVV